MYRGSDSATEELFPDFLPFGGKLSEENRWVKAGRIMPWGELETQYQTAFSRNHGRPSKEARKMVGHWMIQRMEGLSDADVTVAVSETPGMQYFCGARRFEQKRLVSPSLLSKRRTALGPDFFQKLDAILSVTLVKGKMVKARGLIMDGTVVDEKIKYPNDVGLLNDARTWLVRTVRVMGRTVGKAYRTCSRTAGKVFLGFSKLKRKSKKTIRKAKKQMLQFVRRNIKQVQDAVGRMQACGERIGRGVREKLAVAEQIFVQQWEMHRTKTMRIADRIVSFSRPFVRPIKRGKSGKDVEFGPKVALMHVDGFLLAARIDHGNFSEADVAVVKAQVERYEALFGHLPPWGAGDKLYGNRAVRDYLEGKGIRMSLRPLGRPAQTKDLKAERWYRDKQNQRNRIEGRIGNAKEGDQLGPIRYPGENGAQIWIYAGLAALNLKLALGRM